MGGQGDATEDRHQYAEPEAGLAVGIAGRRVIEPSDKQQAHRHAADGQDRLLAAMVVGFPD